MALVALALVSTIVVGAVRAAGSDLAVSENGYRFLRNHEGFRPHVYDDAAKHCTIGYGHLVHRGRCTSADRKRYPNGLTEAEAAALLQADARRAAATVNGAVHVPLTQNQFDSLVSFAYNVGGPAFAGSTLVRVLNAGHSEQVPAQLRRWVHGNGRVIVGLVNRRAHEVKLFGEKGTPGPAPGASPGCMRFEIHFGQKVTRKSDGTFVLGQHILGACWPRAVTLTIVNETPAILFVQGSGYGPGRTPQRLACGGPPPIGQSGNDCTIQLQVFDPPWADPRANASFAFNVPRVVMRAVVTPPSGERARGYQVEWQTVKGGVQPCGGQAFSSFCQVWMGENGDPSDPQAPRLARPSSVTLKVRAEFQ